MQSLIAECKTTNQVIELRAALEELMSLAYTGNGKNEASDKLAKRLPSELVEVVLARLSNASKWDEEVNKMIEEIKRARTVRVTIAFEPREEFLFEISEMIKEKYGDDCVVDLTVDRGILGGLVIEVEGKYKDFSVRKLLDQRYA